MSTHWILDGHEPVEATLEEWGKWFEGGHNYRKVALTDRGSIRISTVFLGIDHDFGGSGPPILFETMIFGGEHDEYQERYTTWDQAEAGHKRAVEMVHLEEVSK